MSGEELKALVRQRGSFKHRLTSFKHFVDQCEASGKLSESLSEIKLRFNKIEDLFDNFQEVQEKIETLAEEDTLTDHFAYRDDFENTFYSYADKVESLLHKPQKQRSISSQSLTSVDALSDQQQGQAAAAPDPGASSAQPLGFITNSQSQFPRIDDTPVQEPQSLHLANSLRLPTVDLPKFSGDYHSWLEFKDTFESLVHNNDKIPDILKFHYLRSSLTGFASQHIQAVEFSAANYSVAWEGLLERFNNHRLLIHNHVRSIFELGNLKKDTHGQIRHLLDRASKHLQSLKALGEPIEYWDTMIIYIICNKLDETTAREWEHDKGRLDRVTLEDLYSFLKTKADQLEALSMRESKPRQLPNTNKKCNLSTTPTQEKARFQCFFCKGKHMIYKCSEFLNLSVQKRQDEVRKLKLCQNCLGMHDIDNCTRGSCRKCNEKHNSLLHADAGQNSEVSTSHTGHSARGSHVLLATACVSVITPTGETLTARALLDSGSQSNFCTKDLWKRVGVPQIPTKMSIVGISSVMSEVTKRCTMRIHSKCASYSKNISCFILDEITDNLPVSTIDTEQWSIPSNIQLADPSFPEPGNIDLLLGAGVLWEVLCDGKISVPRTDIIIQNTLLGWIASGTLPIASRRMRCNFARADFDVQKQLEKFWELDEIPKQRVLTPDEQRAENHFRNTHSRHSDGRFMVKLPLKVAREALGESRQAALGRFQVLERKFSYNDTFRQMYISFMTEYEALGHMVQVEPSELPITSYYLPTHGVFKQSSETTRLRVVFDGSSKSSTNISVNDLQLVGPTIQDDLLSIFLRFRFHAYVIGADIRMMYRQIWLHPEDRPLQCILWRSDFSQDIKPYMLNTITYGMASSPYLAIRCLQQLALDAMESEPIAAQTIMSDFYVDDLLTGGQTVQETVSLAKTIEKILNSAHFPLHKWVSNNHEILQHFVVSDGTVPFNNLTDFGTQMHTKTLGLFWSPEEDLLKYSVKEFDESSSRTKRSLLSDISQVWDPMGLIAPCITSAKIILQKLWLLKLNWDDEIPDDLRIQYDMFRRELSELNALNIPRRVHGPNPVLVHLCGFADASREAYGACLYVRSIHQDGVITANLLCARSRVAPLKAQTIPRLELCAALTLAELTDKVVSAVKFKFDAIYLWSDSSIVLHWLRIVPNNLQVFVANRVARIISLSQVEQWHHVSSHCNPADIVSRGVSAETLSQNKLWWHGPEWLCKPEHDWPVSSLIFEKEPPELRKAAKSLVSVQNDHSFQIFDRYSSVTKLKRVTAYCLRFVHNCRVSPNQREVGPLSARELDVSMTKLINLSQAHSFSTEIKLLSCNQFNSIKGPLKRLNAFIDSHGLLRVGGRMNNSPFPYDKKHPLVLSARHALTKLIFAQAHLDLLHAAPQLLLYNIRETYWPIGGRSLARSIVHKCIKCFKTNPSTFTPQMGSLPADRLKPNYPFAVVGTDFAGPFLIRDRKGRNCKHVKCYICLFICFSSKAIHLEAVTDLSTDSFLACFKRFCSRRGKPSHIFSDNGTNFVGAKNELQELYKALIVNCHGITEGLAEEGISWHMIPPRSPHFGGLWEAGVKTVKYHLKRVMGNAFLTYELFYTTLTQIEAVVNSRPLSPLSPDPNDVEALSPAHLLIGRKLTSTPEPDYTHVKENRLSIFQRAQVLQQHFWQRWSKEYVSELQERQKWHQRQEGPEKDTLVIIKDNNLPPLQWQLGRIIEVFPGLDGVARVATIKTAKGVTKRALAKICPLPIKDDIHQ